MQFFMVSFLAVCLFVASTMAFKMPEISEPEIMKLKEECMKESGVDQATLEKFVEHHKGGAPPNPADLAKLETPETQCFAKCMAVRMHYVTEAGEPDFEYLGKQFDIADDHELMVAAKKCGEDFKGESNACVRVANIQKCLMEDVMKFMKNMKKD